VFHGSTVLYLLADLHASAPKSLLASRLSTAGAAGRDELPAIIFW